MKLQPHEYEIFTFFQFLTRFLTSKYKKLFSTYLVGRNGAMWKTCFSAPQNAKKKICWNIKTKSIKVCYWHLGLREWRIILVITRWAHNIQTFTLISKINENWEIIVPRNRVFKHNEVDSKLHVLLIISWKCAHHIYFTFLQDIYPPHIRNN